MYNNFYEDKKFMTVNCKENCLVAYDRKVKRPEWALHEPVACDWSKEDKGARKSKTLFCEKAAL